LIYFARPDSVMFGHSVARVRLDLGVRLAAEAPADADFVTPVPDSAIHGSIGYANASGIPLTMAFHRHASVGRSFIAPDAAAREAAVRAKLSAIPSLVVGRRVVVVDDSIVRGTTCRKVIRSLRQAGAHEVHVRVTSPPTIAPCHFGIDTPDPAELFATGRDDREMARSLDADSIQFLSLEGLMAVVRQQQFCAGCISGRYPVAIPGGAAPLRWHERRDAVPTDRKLTGSS
jgi:amidophosphoribosyltransferase